MKRLIASLQQQKVTIESRKLGEPTRTYEAGDEEVCFLPHNSVMKVGAVRVKSVGFLVCVRKGAKGSWLFLDGAGMRNNKEMLWELLPELPKELELPPNSNEVIEGGDEE